MIDWLLLPWSGSALHHIEAWAHWHARCMVAGWGVLLPLGALVARFYKVTPRQDWPRELDNKAWWHGHRALQWSGVALVKLGVALAWDQGTAAAKVAQWHAGTGWAVSVAA